VEHVRPTIDTARIVAMILPFGHLALAEWESACTLGVWLAMAVEQIKLLSMKQSLDMVCRCGASNIAAI